MLIFTDQQSQLSQLVIVARYYSISQICVWKSSPTGDFASEKPQTYA